ncbi:MAG: methyltransferase domain-containing protein [Acidobacteriota bacterium]
MVDAAFWIVLARGPSDRERRERAPVCESEQGPDRLLRALIASPEFRLIYDAYAGRGERTGRKPAEVEAGLDALGPNDRFLDQAYTFLLGRPPDVEGAAYYRARLEDGAPRQRVLQALVASEEFEHRYREICPDIGVLPRDVQLCELANPAKWDNPEWVSLLASLNTMPIDKLSMHRKGYEFAQLLFGLARLDRVRGDARVLSVGAGHEPPLYWLANRTRLVVATDVYDTGWKEAWASEGDDTVLKRPEDYAPFPYERGRLVFAKMDGRHLAFADASFDIVYSLSSIEHFGGISGATAAMDDMIRVLRPGGILVIATEYCTAGPPHHEAFQPHEVQRLLARPGARLIEPVDEGVHRRYELAPVDLRRNPFQTPHMAVRDGDTVFTSVVAFLERTGRPA